MTLIATRASQRTQIDHIILGAPELESAMTAFEQQTGVRPLHGGLHPNLGTENALVSLGDDFYLEIIAPHPHGHNESDVAKRLAR